MTDVLDAETETQTKAVIYTRISSAAQASKGHGLASQETRCREFARMKGYDVAEVFSDSAVSGGLVDRPGISAMLRYLKKACKRSAHVVLIDDISRIARDIEAHLQLRRAITDAGAKLESPSIEFGEDSDSVLVENLLASVSQHQRQKNAEQTKNRMRARIMNGYWPFGTTILGYKMERQAERGKVLVRDEPLASIITEALEGMASGRFQTQSEVRQFLQHQEAFPKNRYGKVTDETANRILTRVLYAGMVEKPEWGITIHKGQHEGLVSYDTFLKVQDQLKTNAYAPTRTDLNEDFILRGSVACAECGNPMTGAWSTGRGGKKHPYYMCFKKGCSAYRKSIRRDVLEGAFADMLSGLTPSKKLITLAKAMFRDIWSQLTAQAKVQQAHLKKQLHEKEKATQGILDRLVEADNPSVITAYEKRLAKLESEKLLITEKLEGLGNHPRSNSEAVAPTQKRSNSEAVAHQKTRGFEEKFEPAL